MRMWTYWLRNYFTGEVKEIFIDHYLGEPGERFDNNYIIEDYATYIHNTFM